MAIQATGRATFMAVEDYDIVFALNGIRCDVLNFDSVRTADSATLEADFFNGGTSCVVDKAVLCCYDGEGTLLGSPIEVHDTSTAVADGGNLYLSKDCKTITCDIYAGGKKLLSKTLPVIRDGSSVGVKAVSYKVINNVAANASLNWDSVTSQTAYPTQKPDKGKYCYVMTIVLYTDGTSTNTVSTSYTPNDGVAGTSVKVTSTMVEYAGGDSGTTAPTSGWQGTVPQLSQGKYLWTRTTVAYSDGNSTTSYSVGRIGMDGSKGGTTHILYASSANPQSEDEVRTTIDATHQYYGTYQDTEINDDVKKWSEVKRWVLIKGEKGVDGTQYRTVEKYAYGDSNTTAPTSGWSDSISGGTAGKYLWNQETVQHKAATDTDWKPDSVTTHCIGYIAKNGSNFTGVLEYYKATNDGANAPTVDGSWQTSPTAAGWSADKPYLWNYEIITRDNGLNNITTKAHLDGVWGKKGDNYSVVFLFNGVRVDVLNFDDVRMLDSSTLEADFYNHGEPVSVARAILGCFDKEGTQLGSYIDVWNTNNIVADGGKLLSKSCRTITVEGFDISGKVLFSGTVAVIRDTVTHSLIKMADCSATVKASGSSTSATFSLVYTLHYKAVKMIGDRTEDAKIATISATIEDSVKTATINSTEGILSGTGSKSYTSDNRPADAIQVTVTLSDGEVLYDSVPITMEAGVAIDINKNLATITTTLADQSGNINTIKNTANSNKATISTLDGRVTTVEQTANNISLKVAAMNFSLHVESHQYDYATSSSFALSTLSNGGRGMYISTNSRGTTWFLVRGDGSVSGNTHYYDTYTNASLCDTMATDLHNTRSSAYVLIVITYDATSMTQKLLDELAWWGLDPTAVAPYSGQRIAFAFVGQAALGSGRGWWCLASGSSGNAKVDAMVSNGHVVAQYTGADAAQKRLLLATGIDIEHWKITATADKFVVNNNSGKTTFYIDENGNIMGAGDASFQGKITGSTINGGTINGSTINSKNGPSTTTIAGGQITTNNISATGGNISFFRFDNAGMYSGSIEQNGKIYSGLGMSMNNLSVSGNTNRRLSSVFLGSGWKDSRYTNSDNYRPYRVGSTSLTSTFYNYIKLERIGSGPFSYENSPEHAALGIETQGDFCLTALGGPSQFAGMCLASDTVSAGATANKNHAFYLCSGGAFWMPSDPPVGLFIVVIQSGSEIRFYSNGHKFRSGTNYNDTCNSRSVGQWTMFYFDGSYWNTVYLDKRPW